MFGRISLRIRSPRRTRRGLTALTVAIFLSGVLAIAISGWQIDVARARIEGEVRHLAEVVAAEGYGLHHWLHETSAGGFICGPDDDPPCTRSLEADEPGELAGHAAIASWRRDGERVLLARGWSIEHLIADVGTGPTDGVIVLRPGDDVVNHSTWPGTIRAVNAIFGTGAGLAMAAADDALSDFNSARDRAVLASRYARLDKDALLREPQAGHPVHAMETSLNMGGNQITNVEQLHASGATIPTISAQNGTLEADRLDLHNGSSLNGAFNSQTVTLLSPPGLVDDHGNCLIPGQVNDHGDCLIPVTVQASGNATVSGGMRIGAVTEGVPTGRVTINGTTTTSKLTACIDPDADLCGGGDLEMLTIKDGSTLTNVQVFGVSTVDPEATDPSTVTTTSAKTGLFDEVERPRMTTTGCFRSVTPFVYGTRC